MTGNEHPGRNTDKKAEQNVKEVPEDGKNPENREKMVKHPLDHPKKALVYTQIYLSPETITAKEIANNTGLALNTVYNYIRELSEESIILSRSETVGNLIQERWSINPDYVRERKNQLRGAMNTEYGDFFLTEPKELERQLVMLNSFAIPYITSYARDEEKFLSVQETSRRPALIKIWSLYPEEYEYVLEEIEKIRKKLRTMNEDARSRQNGQAEQVILKGEDNLVFMVALPSLK